MIPTMIRIQISEKGGKAFKIVFPVIFIWIILFAFILFLAPLMIIISLIIWPSGYGKPMLMFPLLLFITITALHNLFIDVQSKDEIIYISFY